MGYVQNSAAPGEQIIGTATFSWLYLAFTMAPFWIGMVIIYVGFQAATRSQMLAAYVPHALMDYGFIALLVIGLIYYLAKAAPWMSMEIAATSHRIVYSHGFLNRHTEEVAINRLEGVKLNQSFIGRIFNFGSLAIYGVGMDEIFLPPISNPMEFRRAVQEAVNLSESPDAHFMGNK